MGVGRMAEKEDAQEREGERETEGSMGMVWMDGCMDGWVGAGLVRVSVSTVKGEANFSMVLLILLATFWCATS
jgi:hypothetical protein